MTTYTNPHATEVAHDERLLELMHEAHVAQNRINGAKVKAAATTGYGGHDRRIDVWERRSSGSYRHYLYQHVPAEELPAGIMYEQAKTWERGEAGTYITTGTGRKRARTTDAIGILGEDHPEVVAWRERVEEYRVAAQAVIDHEKGYSGWPRFFLVVSSAGHIHRSMECSTCYDTTAYALIPSLSCATEAEAVALAGPNLCSVCYPAAPVTDVGGKITQALATILIEEGEEAFLAKIAENKATRCIGSGTVAPPRDPARYWGGSYYATCPACGHSHPVTSTGKFRAHKPQEVK